MFKINVQFWLLSWFLQLRKSQFAWFQLEMISCEAFRSCMHKQASLPVCYVLFTCLLSIIELEETNISNIRLIIDYVVDVSIR